MAMTNAEKQAAFRKRRAAYIRGLERKLRKHALSTKQATAKRKAKR